MPSFSVSRQRTSYLKWLQHDASTIAAGRHCSDG